MKALFIGAVALLTAGTVFGQKAPLSKPGGFWVVESNVKSPKAQVVKFYNQKQELIYQEAVSNRKLKIEKARIRKALDKALHQVLISTPSTEKGTLNKNVCCL